MRTSKRDLESVGEDTNLNSSQRKRWRSSLAGIDVSNILSSADDDGASVYCLRRSSRLSRKSLLPYLSQLTPPEKDVSQAAKTDVVPASVMPPPTESAAMEVVVTPPVHPPSTEAANKQELVPPVQPPLVTETATSVSSLSPEQPADLAVPSSVVSTQPLPEIDATQPNPVAQQPSQSTLQKVPDWLNVNKNYVPPALRGLETISEAAALKVGPDPRPPPPRGRRKKLPTPAVPPPAPAPLRILSFNDPAILCEVQADPEAPLSKFHIASARARMRRQRLRLKKLLSTNGGRCPPRISLQTEHRFAEFLAYWEMDAFQQSPS